MRHLRPFLALLLIVVLTGGSFGCQHYHDSTRDWQAADHSAPRQWCEIPMGVLCGAPMTVISLALFPFEFDKGRPSFVEYAAITWIAVDPRRSLVDR